MSHKCVGIGSKHFAFMEGNSMGTSRVLVVTADPQIDQEILLALQTCSFVGTRSSSLPEQLSELLRYDLLLVDCLELALGGHGIIEKLLDLKRSTILVPPTIAVLSEAQLSLGITFLKDGRADFIRKPVNPAELQARMERLLREERTKNDLNMAKIQRMGTVQFINSLTAQQLMMLEDIACLESSLKALLPDICEGNRLQVMEQGCLAIKELTALCRKLMVASEEDSAQWFYVMEELRDKFRDHPWKCHE